MRGWLSAGLVAVALSAAAQAPPEPPRGVVLPEVAYQKWPGHRYALYLPSGYTPEKAWPAIFCLDPGGIGDRPVRLLAPAAEKYGYILLGSYDSVNGPWEPMVQAQTALYEEGCARYAVHPKRAYAAGLSGGARAALYLALSHPDRFAGVLSCGAFFSPHAEVQKGSPLAFYLVAGDRDFNLFEVTRARRELSEKGVRCWFAEFAGDHRWPPEAVAAEGFGYFEAEAVRAGLLPEDRSLFERMVRERAASAEAALALGSATAAWRQLTQTAGLCRERADVSALTARAKVLEKDPRVKARLALEPEFEALWRELLGEGPLAGKVSALRSLSRTVQRGGLKGAFGQVLLPRGCEAVAEAAFREDQKDHPAAVEGIDAAVEACPADRTLLYNAACLHARSGDKPGALQLIRRALEAGFTDRTYLERDPDLLPLRSEPEFQRLLERAKAADAP